MKLATDAVINALVLDYIAHCKWRTVKEVAALANVSEAKARKSLTECVYIQADTEYRSSYDKSYGFECGAHKVNVYAPSRNFLCSVIRTLTNAQRV
jgi:hypothetical protein